MHTLELLSISNFNNIMCIYYSSIIVTIWLNFTQFPKHIIAYLIRTKSRNECNNKI